MAAERIQKVLARAGVASRRAAEELVREGRVTVNGIVVREAGTKCDPAREDVRVDGERVRIREPRYFLVHKPVGVVTTLRDPEGRATITSLLPPGTSRVVPVGRLDTPSSGLVLLTDDGELAARLLHPRSQVPRTYRVKVQGRPDSRALARLRRGVRLDDGRTGHADVVVEEELPRKTWLRVTIREGRRREVRRMCETVGHRVDKLVRVGFGPLRLGNLPPGASRPLRAAEVRALRELGSRAPKGRIDGEPGVLRRK